MIRKLIRSRLHAGVFIQCSVVFACATISVVSSSAQEPQPQSLRVTASDLESELSASESSPAEHILDVRKRIAEAYGFGLHQDGTRSHEQPTSKTTSQLSRSEQAPEEQVIRDATEVREFVLTLPEQDNPSFYSALLTNAGSATATFSMTFNGSLYRSSDDLCADVTRMPSEYPNEPVYRKAWRFVRDHRYHYTPLTGLRWQHTPALFFNSIGFGYCDDSASLLYYLWHRLGYEARVWCITGHVIPEVHVNGRWEMYDAGLPGVSEDYYDNYRGLQQCVYYYNREGQVAGVEELAADGTLITEPHNPINPLFETSHPYYCYSSNVSRLYTSTRNNRVENWYMVDEPQYSLLFQIPPGGCLLLPGHATHILRVTCGDPAPPLMATALLIVPAGFSGTLDNRLVVHSIHGNPLDTVRICGQDFHVGSPELQNFIDGRVDGQGGWFSAMTFARVTARTEVVFLLNPMLVEMQHHNVLRLTGSQLGGMVAETRGVTPYPDLGDSTGGDANGLYWNGSAGLDDAFQVSTNLLSSAGAGLVVSPAQARYSGGSGQANDPYQIATAADLILLGNSPGDYGKHFILTADVDLDPNLPGRKVFEKAIVASGPSSEGGDPFTGVFDGRGHTISHLTIKGGGYLGLFRQLASGAEIKDLGVVDVNIMGSGDDVGGLVGESRGTVTGCYSTGLVTGHWGVGGLMGENRGVVTQCCSTGEVKGQSYVGGLVGYTYGGRVTGCFSSGAVSGNRCVGGLVGDNSGVVTSCYGNGEVIGTGEGSWAIGGLVGDNSGSVTHCYSTGPVCGTSGSVGGLVGWTGPLAGGVTTACFWDTQTSGQAASAGGEGLTTGQMQTARTFLIWGTCDNEGVWTIDEGKDCPRLGWEDRPGEAIRLARLSDLLQGTGTEDDPFLIYTPEELNRVGLFPCQWDKHFRLMADIDLSALDGKDGRPAFNIIAPGRAPGSGNFLGTPFTGVFDGNDHGIWHLTETVTDGGCAGLFGGLGSGAEVKDLGVIDVNITSSGGGVGGLVGYNYASRVTQCYSTGAVTGRDYSVGGLAGWNYGTVTQCYSAGVVRGDGYVGGLVGFNWGAVTGCYSTGPVSGTARVGGLVGYGANVSHCLWDMEASGQATSGGGTGKNTAQMHVSQTFLDAGWDILGETANGTKNIWGISEGKDYPRFVWQLWASSPDPGDGAIDVIQTPTLSWRVEARASQHDIYFADNEQVVADATPSTPGVYRGRQPAAMTTYGPGVLEWGKTYYWRIDEVQEADPRSPWKGGIWSFSTADSVLLRVVDDFESYTDDWLAGPLLFDTWNDGGGSLVGNWDPPEGPYAEQVIVHGGRQSMPMEYHNTGEPWYSQAERTWETPQDWTLDDAEALTLYFRGQVGNGPDPLYVAIEDSAGLVVIVTHPDPNAAMATRWQKWDIPLPDVRAAGVDVAAVNKMVIGVGDPNSPGPGGTGKIYIDDIRLTKRMP